MKDKPFTPQQPLRLGTRGSPLALAQARMAEAALAAAHGASVADIATIIVQTQGDRIQDRPLAEIGGKALWTKELDRALIEGEVDFAVHSMKDVETTLAPGIALAAVLPRADPRDRLVGAESLAAIPHGATVGTSSPRRAAQLLNRRPDLSVISFRGNVQTRLRQLEEGKVAATFLAAAGLDRLGIAAGVPLDPETWLPAASQAIVGITCRADDAPMLALLAAINDTDTMQCLLAERALLRGLGGSCHTAVAAQARTEARTEAQTANGLRLDAELLSPDGRDCVAGSILSADSGMDDPDALGAALARRLLEQATPAILRSLEQATPAILRSPGQTRQP